MAALTFTEGEERGPKDPQAVLDYSLDWELDEGDTISASSWAIVVGAGLVIDSENFGDDYTTVWLSAGVAGTTYKLTNTISTVDGRTDERTINLKVKQR